MSTGNRFPVPKTPEERAEYVAAHFENCGPQVAAYIRQLRADFRALKRCETIMGCKTWTEFCEKVLKRTDRAVRYTIAGGNPRWKRKPTTDAPRADSRMRAVPFNWKQHWQDMPDFKQDDQEPFRTLHVHFADQKSVDEFAKLISQPITLKTRFVWYPQMEKRSYAHQRYVDARVTA